MVLTASGPLSISAVRSEFGTGFSSYSMLYGIASGMPSTGPVSLSNLYGKSASVPSVSAVATQNNESSIGVNASLNAISLASVSDTYGGTLTYSITSVPAGVSASVNGTTGVVTYSAATNSIINGNMVLNVTNRFGKSNNITVPVSIGTKPTVSTTVLSTGTLISGNWTTNLASLFSNPSGATLTYTVTSSPYSNASISGSTLTITSANRNTSYNVTVTATNVYGTSASATTISVTESGGAPTVISGGGSLPNVTSGNFTFDLSTLFSNPSGATMSYTITYNPYNNASISVSTLRISGNYRNIAYSVNVTATNMYGTSPATTVMVTEISGAPNIITSGSIPNATSGNYTINLTTLFSNPSGATLTYIVTGNPYGNASISGQNVVINCYCRNTSYNVYIKASNNYGYSQTSVMVTEIGSPPTAVNGMAVSNITNWWYRINLYYLFTSLNPTSAPFTYTITYNPYNSVSITSGSTLLITGRYLNTMYNVYIQASNNYGSASVSLNITEPSNNGRTGPSIMNAGWYVVLYTSSFLVISDQNGGPVTWSIAPHGYYTGPVSIDSSGYITFGYIGGPGSFDVTATNSTGSDTRTFSFRCTSYANELW